ncbi:MAG: C10 family peptidase [Acidobacteriota bacterium]
MRKLVSLVVVLTVLAGAATVVLADPVSAEQAMSAVAGWLRLAPRPLNARMSAVIKGVDSEKGPGGEIIYYAVRLDPAGFVVVAPDDYIHPIIAFSANGFIDPNPQNPLYDFLMADMPDRLRWAREMQTGGPEAAHSTEVSDARETWRRYLNQDARPGMDLGSVPSPSDPRVDAFVQSRWNQGNDGGGLCYNYFTPNNWVCGCVATAMSQLMRFHQHPTSGIGVHSYTIYVGPSQTPQSENTMGGDGSGGAYDWANMPYDPPGSTPDNQRRAIGYLTHDTGASVNMWYQSGGSAADTLAIAGALTSRFGYSNAIAGYNSAQELVGHGLYEMVNPNLDAGLPVNLGITGAAGGHAIVCDGYGYSSGKIYHHLNMGWSGSSDTWYDLPYITSSPSFNKVYKCVYNVFVSGGGEILSGRVLDGCGNPISGALVTAGAYSDTSDARGIYALVHVPAGTYTVSASKAGCIFLNQSRTVGTSVGYSTTVGNLWGVNFVDQTCLCPSISTQPQSQTVASGGTVTLSVAASGTAPLHYQWYQGAAGDTSTPVGTDSASYTTAALSATTNFWVRVTNVCGAANSNTATVTVGGGGCTAPLVIEDPQSQTISSGQTASLSVTASGTAPLHYQWYQGLAGDTSTPVGTDSSSYTTVALAATAYFWTRVTNACGTADSSTATITVTAGCPGCPTITRIKSKTSKPGSSATIRGNNFSADASKIKVYFGTRLAKITRARLTSIKVEIPKRCRKGICEVRVIVDGKESNHYRFEIK